MTWCALCRQEEGSNPSWSRLHQWDIEAHTRRGARSRCRTIYLDLIWRNISTVLPKCKFCTIHGLYNTADLRLLFCLFLVQIAVWTEAKPAVSCQGTTGVWGSAAEGPVILHFCRHHHWSMQTVLQGNHRVHCKLKCSPFENEISKLN